MESIAYLTNKIIQLEIIVEMAEGKISKLQEILDSSKDELQETKRVFALNYPRHNIDAEISKEYNALQGFYENYRPSLI